MVPASRPARPAAPGFRSDCMVFRFLRRPALCAVALVAFGLSAAALSGSASASDPIRLPKPRPATAPVKPATTADVDMSAAKADPKVTLPPPPANPKPYGYGRIIVLRGLGNIFSRGMDRMAKEMQQYGLPVQLANHSRWHQMADQIIADYKAKQPVEPVILIGHSLGADASLVMANWLAHNGIRVRLVVAFDGVADILPITNPTVEVINYYKPTAGYGKKVVAAPNFKGTLVNIDMSDRKDIDHLNIDKMEGVQDEMILKVLDIMKKKPAAVAAKN
jgi:pimeloyl-ACP methyl ester carboxylesterase